MCACTCVACIARWMMWVRCVTYRKYASRAIHGAIEKCLAMDDVFRVGAVYIVGFYVASMYVHIYASRARSDVTPFENGVRVCYDCLFRQVFREALLLLYVVKS